MVQKSITVVNPEVFTFYPRIILEFSADFPARNLHVIYAGTRTYSRDRKHDFSNTILYEMIHRDKKELTGGGALGEV